MAERTARATTALPTAMAHTMAEQTTPPTNGNSPPLDGPFEPPMRRTMAERTARVAAAPETPQGQGVATMSPRGTGQSREACHG